MMSRPRPVVVTHKRMKSPGPRPAVLAPPWTSDSFRHDDERVRTIVDGTLGGDAEDWLRTETG